MSVIRIFRNRLSRALIRRKFLLYTLLLANIAGFSYVAWTSTTHPGVETYDTSGSLQMKEVKVPGCGGCSRPQYVAAVTAGTEPVEFPDRCPTLTSAYRGRRQRVISFSLYNRLNYFERIPGLAESAEKLYPSSDGWVMRIYHDFQAKDEGFLSAMCNITCRYGNVDFCDMRLLKPPAAKYYEPGVHPMIWRFMPMADETAEVFLSRDLDSDLTAREASAVDAWINTSLPLHVMRDNPLHGTTILGGMWGAQKSTKYRGVVNMRQVEENMLNLSINQYKTSQFGRDSRDIDQQVLAQAVYPAICGANVENATGRLCYVHDSYLCNSFRDSVPWPTQRVTNEKNNFVGANGHPPMLVQCPMECRPKEHQDWIYC